MLDNLTWTWINFDWRGTGGPKKMSDRIWTKQRGKYKTVPRCKLVRRDVFDQRALSTGYYCHSPLSQYLVLSRAGLSLLSGGQSSASAPWSQSELLRHFPQVQGQTNISQSMATALSPSPQLTAAVKPTESATNIKVKCFVVLKWQTLCSIHQSTFDI